jgi:hypothetical protein
MVLVPSPVGLPGVQSYVYAPVPPETEIEAVPLFTLHDAIVEFTVEVIAAGCVMLNVLVIVHPLASVAVTVYAPAHSAVAEEPVPPEGAQR